MIILLHQIFDATYYGFVMHTTKPYAINCCIMSRPYPNVRQEFKFQTPFRLQAEFCSS